MSYKIIPANLQENKPDILALWKRNFPDALSYEERYSWLYENNPYAPPKCWLAKYNKTGEFVGCASIIFRKMYVNGQPLMTGIAADFAVDKYHRGFGPAFKLQRVITSYCIENEIDLIYGYPNKQSEAVHLRVGFKILGKIGRFVKLLRTQPIIERYVNSRIAKIISPMADFALNKSFCKGLYRDLSHTSTIINSFDERFDVLWKKTFNRNLVIGERSSTYLNWRYRMSPHNRYEILTIADKNQEKIYAYLVYYLKNKIAYISDILCENPLTRQILISEFVNQIKQRNIDKISIIILDGHQFITWLEKNYFFPRKENSNFFIFLRQDSPKYSFLLEPQNWFIFEGDRDI